MFSFPFFDLLERSGLTLIGGLAGDFPKSPLEIGVGWISKQDSAAIGVCSGSLSTDICVAIYLFSRWVLKFRRKAGCTIYKIRTNKKEFIGIYWELHGCSTGYRSGTLIGSFAYG